MKSKAAMIVFSAMLATCFAVEPTTANKAVAQPVDYVGPVSCSEGWYCPHARWDAACYVRTHCRQEVCAFGVCRTNRWWL